jgi:hypothetical protein
MAVLGSTAAVQIGTTRNSLKGDAAMRLVLSQMHQAREMAITQRRYVRLTFDAVINTVSLVREDSTTATTTLSTVWFEGSTRLTLVSGVPDTPDAFGMSAATSFTSTNGTFESATGTSTIVKFAPDGTLVDWNGRTTNGTVFTAIPNIAVSARAVTVLGSTGRVRGYRWDGHSWKGV